MNGGYAVKLTASFQRDYDKLSADIQELVEGCILDIGQDPIPASRRAHSVTPKGKTPKIFTMDVTSNKAYKLSFHLEGRVAFFRRIGTHAQIDRRA